MIGFPLDSHVVYDESGIPSYDRAVSSAPLRELIKRLFSDGVMPDSTSMQISAKTGMTLEAHRGFAICNGCMKLLETEEAITIAPADSAYPRIDKIVLRLDDNADARSCEIAVKKGTPSASPKSLDVNRTATIWEIALADVMVKANATAITNADIKDLRYDSSVCGVISSISEFDTSTLYQQIQSDMDGFKENEQTEFLEWFENIRGQLSVDAAGNLQNQINVERGRIDEIVAQKSTEVVDEMELEFTGEYSTCTSIKAISNGISAELYIANLKWMSSMIKTYDTIAEFPENLIPLTQSKPGVGTRPVIYDADDIQIVLRENRLQIYRKEGSTAKTHTCMVSYALKNPVMEELSDLRVDVNGERHPSAGDALRAQIEIVREEAQNAQSVDDGWEFKGITFEDVRRDVALNNYKEVEVGVSSFSSCFSFMTVEGHCVYGAPMKKGESFVLSNAFVLTSNVFEKLIITDKNGIIRYVIPFSELNATRGHNGCYTFDEDGVLFLCFDYTAVNTAEFFYIRKPNANHPLTIYAEHADFYLNNSNYGDKALDAIMTGRQILVRTPNADRGSYTAIYSPVYMYQLPNKENNYLYLFYLKDEKQTIDLSAMGMGVIQMPVYGELKMLLSNTYNACPLEG